MDWFSWLSKTGLDESLVYEYGIIFGQNELEEDDVAYFNHEFLQSMGISIAKHRLEILKLARKTSSTTTTRRGSSMSSRLLVAIKSSKTSLVNYVRAWIHPQDSSPSSSALAVVPRKPSSPAWFGSRSRWRGGAMLKRNNKPRLLMIKQQQKQQQQQQKQQQHKPRLLLTGPHRIDSFSSPLVVCDYQKGEQNKMDVDDYYDDHDHDHDDGYYSTPVEEIRWDTMFQDLKPT